MKSTSIKALSVLLMILMFGCSSEKEPAKTLPQLTTTTATSVTLTAASTGGNVSADGGAPVTSRGVVWSTASAPTISLATKTTDGTGTGSFTSAITNLNPSTNYYVRAYATNSVGTGYGNEITFTTGAVVLPTLTTTTVSGLTTNSAISGGTISADGGGSITARGVVWNTGTNPTVLLNTKTTEGTGTGNFISTIANLNPSTNYHARAYASNGVGTAYGNEITFTTGAVVLPTLTTTAINSITTNSAISGGSISADGGGSISARGVVWSTSTSPTISLSTKTNDGTGIGSFTSTIVNLTPATNYYARAYATNSAGTNYGLELTFSTFSPTGSNIWSTKNLDVTTYRDGTPIPNVTDIKTWANLKTGAWCYFNNDSTNGATYGKLYNWYAVAGIHDNDPNTPNKILAPTGWHVSTDGEWTDLITFLGGRDVAGGKMKSTTNWMSPNTGATNESGFSGLPGGYFIGGDFFVQLKIDGNWWSSSEINTTFAKTSSLTYNSAGASNGSPISKSAVFSVRCVKDK